jgi:hypothetical protein
VRAQATNIREQFADGQGDARTEVRRRVGTDEGVYVVNSYAWEEGELAADAAPHDGMVWFYDYRAQTIQPVTYFPHQITAEEGAPPRLHGPHLRWPGQRVRHAVGSLALAEDGAGASHVLGAFPGGPTYAIARNQLNDSEFCGPVFSPDRQGALRQHSGPWPSRALGEIPGLTRRESP